MNEKVVRDDGREFRRGWADAGTADGREPPVGDVGAYAAGWRLRRECPLPGGFGLRWAERAWQSGRDDSEVSG